MGAECGPYGTDRPEEVTKTIQEKCDLVHLGHLLRAEFSLRMALETAVILDRRQDCTREALGQVMGAIRAVRTKSAELRPLPSSESPSAPVATSSESSAASSGPKSDRP